MRAHPRSRGEHLIIGTGETHVSGSSPLARGTLRHVEECGRRTGLIPARAGNTRRCSPRRGAEQAHPRSRGEHRHRPVLIGRRKGSSPLARGTQGFASARERLRGLIPARAGNTMRLPTMSQNLWAHPRSRGEHPPGMPAAETAGGSSPLARGTPPKCRPSPKSSGLIPARAGNTELLNFSAHGVGAHPRSRGEHRVQGGVEPRQLGSSPLARGTPVGCWHRRNPLGLIPARAGNTFVGHGHL